MAHLSDPESVLRKISSLKEKIDEFYETVNLVKELKLKIEDSSQKSLGHENELKDKVDKFKAIESGLNDSLKRLGDIADFADRQLLEIFTQLGYEKESLSELIKKLQWEQERIKKEEQIFKNEILSAAKDSDAYLARLISDFSMEFEKFGFRLEQALDENRKVTNNEIDRIKIFSDTALEEIDYLFRELSVFRESLQKEVRAKLKDIKEDQATFQQSTIYDFHKKFSAERDRLKSKVEDHINSIQSRFKEALNNMDSALSFLDSEKKETERRHNLIDKKTEEFARKIDEMVASSHKRITGTIEDFNNVSHKQLSGIVSFIDNSADEIKFLKSELKTFKDGLARALNREIENIYKKQAGFQEKAVREIFGKLSEETKQLRIKSEEKIRELSDYKNEILDMQRALDESLSEVNRKIAGKTTYFTSQIGNLVVDSRREISSASNEMKNQVGQKLEELSSFAEKAKKELYGLRDSIMEFVKKTREKYADESASLLKKHIENLKKAEEKFISKMEDEADRFKDEARKYVKQEMDAHSGHLNSLTDNLMAKIGGFEKSLDKMEADQNKKDRLMEKIISRIKEQNTSHKKIIKALHKRMEKMENELESLKEKKGIFKFNMPNLAVKNRKEEKKN